MIEFLLAYFWLWLVTLHLGLLVSAPIVFITAWLDE